MSMKIIVLVVLLFTIFSCGTDKNSLSKDKTMVSFSFENLGRDDDLESKNPKEWGQGDPTDKSQFNCYGIFVGYPTDSPNSCVNPSLQVIARPHQMAGLIPVGGSLDLVVDSGPQRKFQVVGFKSNTGCPNVENMTDAQEARMSAPFILGERVVDLAGGTMEVGITTSFDLNKKIKDCKGPMFGWEESCGMNPSSIDDVTADYIKCKLRGDNDLEMLEANIGNLVEITTLQKYAFLIQNPGINRGAVVQFTGVTCSTSCTLTLDYKVFDLATGATLFEGVNQTINFSSGIAYYDLESDLASAGSFDPTKLALSMVQTLSSLKFLRIPHQYKRIVLDPAINESTDSNFAKIRLVDPNNPSIFLYHIPNNSCTKVKVASVGRNNKLVNTTSAVTVQLTTSVGEFYSDSSCESAISEASISASVAISNDIYYLGVTADGVGIKFYQSSSPYITSYAHFFYPPSK